jgi:hypothetical protein
VFLQFKNIYGAKSSPRTTYFRGPIVALVVSVTSAGCATSPDVKSGVAKSNAVPVAASGTGTIYVNRDDVLAGYLWIWRLTV